MTVQIDKGIPMPPHRYNSRYDFRRMEVGDSVPFIGDIRHATSSANYWARSVGNGAKFACRTLEDGTVRIWRVK